MRTGIRTRFTIATSLLVLVATFTVGYTVYRGARQSLITAATDRLAHTAETINVRFSATMEAVGKDVRFLAATPPVQGIVRANSRAGGGLDPETAIRDDEWQVLLEDIFESFLISRPSYLRARFIGLYDGGRELVRVEKQGGNIVRVADDSLEQVAGRPWIQEVSQLPRGALYFSKHALPLSVASQAPSAVSIMHAATPVHTESGRVFGVIVVDVNFTDVMNVLEGLVDSTQTLYVANAEGDLLLRPDSLAPADTARAGLQFIQDLFPHAETLLSGDERELRVPQARVDGGVPGIAYFQRIPFDRGIAQEGLILGVTEPHNTILAGVRRVRNQSALITLLFCLGGIALALSLSGYMVRPLRKITRAVSLFGLEGPTAPLPIDRRDEIGVLARTYDSMAQKIQDQIHALADEELRQRTILETSAEGIVVTDAQGTVETFNPAAERILGYEAADVAGRKAGTFIRAYGHIDGTAAESNGEAWMHMKQGAEAAGRRSDGSMVPIALTWSTFELDGETRYTLFLRDITEQKAAAAAQARLLRELEQERARLKQLSESLEERVRLRTADLVRSNETLERRNQELRDFAHVSSHDLQEPLRRLRNFADMLLSEHADHVDEAVRRYIVKMYDSAERMSQLIADLRSFTTVTAQERPFEVVDLSRIAEEVVSDLEVYIEERNGTVHVGELPTIDADKVQMRQLVQNLIMNGLKFHPPDTVPTVEVFAEIHHADEDGGDGAEECRLMVRDNGIGFEEKYLDRIFSPFQRLHGRDAYEGTGMGLAICRRIVEYHDGSITARSAPDSGTTFIVTLPVHQQKPTPGEALVEEE